jgi:hypothetical protein
VGGQADGRTAGLYWLALLLPVSVAAQVAPNRATLYLEPSDVTDARALWVNPAGLGRFEQASLSADVTVGDPGAGGRLRQFTLGVSSRGLSFGYQRDVFAGGQRSHTYRVGFAAGRNGFAAGLVAALYRGGSSSSGWEAGLLYDWTPAVSVAAVAENVGQPVVGGVTLPVTYVPSITLRLASARGAVSADSRLTSDGVLGYTFGARASLGEENRVPVGLLVRLDTDRSLHRTGFAFGVSIGSRDFAGVVATTPGDASRVDAVSLYGVSTRRFAGARRIRG